jgi:hypothetical protein
MIEIDICFSGPYADSTLAAYRAGEPFMVCAGVTAIKAENGRHPRKARYKGQPVWRLDVKIVSDLRGSEISKMPYHSSPRFGA